MDFFQNGLCFFCNNCINETERLKRYHEVIEAVWSERAKQLESEFKYRISESLESEHQDIGENFNHDYIESIIKYEFLHRQSIVITASSLIEYALYKLCELISSISGNEFKIKNGKSKIKQSISYLATVENFNINALMEQSEQIYILYKVRNEIVHNNGILTENLKKMNVEKLNGSIGGMIEISFDFLDFYLQLIIVFFKKLKNEVTDFMEKNQN